MKWVCRSLPRTSITRHRPDRTDPYTDAVPADADTREPDLPSDWWTSADVRRFLAAHGIKIARTTWSSWVRRGSAPPPDPKGKIGAYPRWHPEDIRDLLAELLGQRHGSDGPQPPPSN